MRYILTVAVLALGMFNIGCASYGLCRSYTERRYVLPPIQPEMYNDHIKRTVVVRQYDDNPEHDIIECIILEAGLYNNEKNHYDNYQRQVFYNWTCGGNEDFNGMGGAIPVAYLPGTDREIDYEEYQRYTLPDPRYCDYRFRWKGHIGFRLLPGDPGFDE